MENPQYSFIGRWVKDVESKQMASLRHYAAARAGKVVHRQCWLSRRFGNGGRSVRSIHRRLGYCRKDGKWLKSDTVTYKVPAEKGEMDTTGSSTSCRKATTSYWPWSFPPTAVAADQIERRTTGIGEKTRLHGQTSGTADPGPARSERGQSRIQRQAGCGVVGRSPLSASPQFAYKVEIFDNPACKGQPLAVREERMPTVQTVLLDAAVHKPTVRLTITDVFDQPAAPVMVTAAAARIQPLPATAQCLAWSTNCSSRIRAP